MFQKGNSLAINKVFFILLIILFSIINFHYHGNFIAPIKIVLHKTLYLLYPVNKISIYDVLVY